LRAQQRFVETVNIHSPSGRPGRVLAIAVFALCGVLAAAGSASADVIVSYALTVPPATATGTPVPPTTTAPTVVAGNLTEQSSLQHFETDHAGPTITGLNAAPAAGTFPTSVDDAFNKSDTFSFTVAPPPGFQLNLSSLTFNVEAGGTANAPSPRGTGVRSSLTGGTDLLSASLPLSSPSSLFESLNLGGNPAFQHITGSVMFTFAVQTPNGNDTIVFNDITLNGTLASVVPEPTTLALFGLGIVGLACGRLRRS
jgi:hypothetical protein